MITSTPRRETETLPPFFSLDSRPAEEIILRSPISGVVLPIENVPDPVFSQKLVGVGVAIDPTDSELISPCAGRVTQIHPARHAITLSTSEGIEILIHIGLDTVKLKGEGFHTKVKLGDSVALGQTLIEFDMDLIAQKAKSLLTEIVITNSDRIEELSLISESTTQAGAPFIRLRLKTKETISPLPTFINPSESPILVQSTDQTTFSQSPPIVINNPTGIHARPAALISHLSKQYRSEIRILKGKTAANARSLVEVMSLEIAQGDSVFIQANGPDQDQATQALVELLVHGIHETPEKHLSHSEHLSHPNDLNRSDDSPKTQTRAETLAKNKNPQNQNSENINLSKSSPTSIQPSILTGVTASPGLAIGQIFQLRSVEFEVHELGRSIETETQLLKAALFEARTQLQTLTTNFEKLNDASKASIFVAHQELLEDPYLLEKVQNEVLNGKSAAFAWKKSYTTLADHFKSLKNQLLAARANDVCDIGQRVLQILCGSESAPRTYPNQCILVSEDLTPSDVATLDRDRVLGFCTTAGGTTSHVAILARSLDLPALASVNVNVLQLTNGTPVILDGNRGELRLKPTADELKQFESVQASQDLRKKIELAHALEPAKTTDGHSIEIVANLKSTSEAHTAVQLGAEGVGLLRTEFLFMNRQNAPDENEQFEAYQTIARSFGNNHPIIIRTLDVGGDKPLSYLPIPKEDNPFLGERGLRVSLSRPDVFRIQLRAILRAAAEWDVRIMFPMVSTLSELRQAKEILEEERVRLKAKKIPVGIMVEVPSVALLAESFARESDFFSIGSNDLSQYTLAIDRGHPRLASQVDGLDPSLLHLIDRSVRAAHAHQRWVGVCGGIASDPQAVPILLGLGVDELSVSIPAIPSIKALIRKLDYQACRRIALQALQMGTSKEVRSLVQSEV